MSVLIKGMEMPESCNACRLLEGDRDDGLCHAANRWLDDDEYWLWHQYPEGDVDTSKPSNCPLIEVVRCKDCKYCEWYIKAHYNNGIEVESHECRKYKMAVTRDWFCADGERREDDAET